MLSCLITWSPAGGDIWKGCGPFRGWHLARGTGSRREWTLVCYSPVPLPGFSLLPGFRCNVTVCSILVGCYAYPAATMHTLPVLMSPLHAAISPACSHVYLACSHVSPACCHAFLPAVLSSCMVPCLPLMMSVSLHTVSHNKPFFL